jgi:HAD superfamily phosphoserine phosphatase-like hydrolase
MLPRRYARAVVSVSSVLVDFDGTISLHDAGVDLLERFGDPARREELAALVDAFEAGTIGLRRLLEAEAASLVASRDELLAFAFERSPIDPTFAPFVAWARGEGLRLRVVSDGFGFHVRPLLAAAGLADLPVLTNDLSDGRLTFGGPHPT